MYNEYNAWLFRKCLTLFMTDTFLAILFFVLLMWPFQSNWQSMCTPRIFFNVKSFNINTVYANHGLLTICFLLITIKLVFDTFKDNLFAINHELNLSSSLETVLHISEISLPVYKKFVSFANIMHFIKDETVCMSFTYIINKIGPNIEPWGTPHVTFIHVEFVSLIETYCVLLVR